MEATRQLTFGGERYKVEVDGREINADWIVRRDKYKELYREALNDAAEIDGRKIISPEWLVVMKYAAGRAKDHLDLLWLLQQKNLVNRKTVSQKLKKLLGVAKFPVNVIGSVVIAGNLCIS